ncbi:MAG: hypothetical protein JSV27_04620 [Candidatus Bathyarchaeota archaeon]|nr:MAG: hypothetical protein JSV27_04620 [Candidatus Bathyarchaeota archaeon]
MVEQISIQTALMLFQTLGICVGVIYHIMTLRNTRRTQDLQLETRQAQLFMQTYDNFIEPTFYDKLADFLTWKWDDYDDFMQKYGWDANPKAWQQSGSVVTFFEGVGVLVQKGLLDINLVGELMTRHVIGVWEKIGPISKEMRRRFNRPDHDANLEYLYDEIKKYEASKYQSQEN